MVELVEADLTNAESLKNAIRGSTHVIHVASPFLMKNPKDPMDVIGPAVGGTKAVLEACEPIYTVLASCKPKKNLDACKPENFLPQAWRLRAWSLLDCIALVSIAH